MILNFANLNQLWGWLIVEEFIRNEIDYFVISPGSRSTPLTVAVARHSQAKKKVCLDERGAAFHALGYARATGKPAVLICTSGTAIANYFPAVIEAFVERLPLIILSGDRPPELQQTGANQTIEQANLFGNYVKANFSLPCPDEKISPQVVLTTVNQVIYQAQNHPASPVHLNCQFREPLAPIQSTLEPNYLQKIERWINQNQPYTYYSLNTSQASQEELERLGKIIEQAHQGILIIGQLRNEAERKAVIALANKLQWLVFADVQSGLRFDNSISSCIHYFDQLLLTDSRAELDYPNLILQIGHRILSKRLLQFIEKFPLSHYIVVVNDPHRQDPHHCVSWKIESDLENFCTQLIKFIPLEPQNSSLEIWQQKNQLIDQTIEKFLRENHQLNEIGIARLISHYLPFHHGLFLASSMPIREMDMYGVMKGRKVAIAANRGTSGIEGTIASAVGFSVGLNAPVTLLIGDLAFLHDLNSLAQLNSNNFPIIIVVINNNGGGIFSFLPIAQFKDVFDSYFGTPHNLEFELIAKTFQLNYYHPQTLKEFREDYALAIQTEKNTLIEVKTNREANYQLHQALQAKIREKLEGI